jgi:hypothetical protein
MCRRIPFVPLTGSLEERLAKVAVALEKFEKYTNFFGRFV